MRCRAGDGPADSAAELCHADGQGVPHTEPDSDSDADPIAEPVAHDAGGGGRNRYQACADGTCEVAVSQPVRIEFDDGGVLRVTKVNADGFDFELSLANGAGGNGTMKGAYPSPEPVYGIFQLQLVGMNGKAAVIRLVSGDTY